MRRAELDRRRRRARIGLGPRQLAVLAWLGERHGEPVSGAAVGQYLHGKRNSHGANECCRFCTKEGTEVLLALAQRRLFYVEQVSGGLYAGVEADAA